MDNPTNNTPEEKKKTVKKIGKIAATIAGIIAAILLLLSIVAFAFEDKITDIFLHRIYQYTTHAEITHKNTSLSLIKRFPLASLQVNDFSVKNTQKNENLLIAGKVYLQFNILDLIKGNYTLKRIDIEKAILNIHTYSDNTNNYNIFITKDTVSNEDFKLDISSVLLKDVYFYFLNDRKQVDINTHIKKAQAKGGFDKKIITANLKSSLMVNSIQFQQSNYIDHRPLNLSGLIVVDIKKNSYHFENDNFNFDFIHFILNGDIDKIENGYSMKGNIQSHEDASIEKLISILPDSIQTKIANYKPKGNIYFNLAFDGAIDNHTHFDISGTYGLDNVDIANIQTNISLSDIDLKGNVSVQYPDYKSSLCLNITQFNAFLNKGNISGALSLSNLLQPKVAFDVNAKFDIKDFQDFVPATLIYQASGNTNINLKFSNEFSHNKNFTVNDINQANMQGNVVFNDVFLQLRADGFSLNNLSGDISLDDKIVHAKQLKGSIKENDFVLTGRIENLLPYIVDTNNDLQIIAYLNVAELNIDKLLKNDNPTKSKASKDENSQQLTFPQHIYLDLEFNANKINYQQFDAQTTKGRIILNKNILSLKNFEINTFSGKSTANGTIAQQKNNQFYLNCDADFRNINIEQLFYGFKNFNQSQLTNKNIRGTANSHVHFESIVRNNVSLIPESVKANADISIYNGQLLNFKPLDALSKFITLSELHNVKFETINTQIHIANKKIDISKIDVRNNVLNLIVSGGQTFDGDIDYHIQLSLKELLSKKLKNNKKQREDFGDIEDDNLGNANIYILASGQLDNPKFKWDSKSAHQGFKQQISTQKEAIQQSQQERDKATGRSDEPTQKDLNNSSVKQKDIELDEDW